MTDFSAGPFWRWSVLTTLALLSHAGLLRADEQRTIPAWDVWSYQIHVLVAVDPALPLDRYFEQDLTSFLQEKSRAVRGGAWQMIADAAPLVLRHQLLHEMDSIDSDQLPSATKEADKVVLLGLRAANGSVDLRAREFDRLTGAWNATVALEARQTANLKHTAFRAVSTVFAPLARVEKTEGNVVTLRLRASSLAPLGQRSSLSGVSVFRPVLLDSHADGTYLPGKSTPIDWTYLTAFDGDGGSLKCRLATALTGDPLPAYHPQRQRLAIGISPPTSSTQLQLVDRSSQQNPVEGCEVLVEESLSGDAPPRLVSVGHSDRRGIVVVPPRPTTVQMLVIRTGEQVLGRMPMVPGLRPKVTLPLSFDRQQILLESTLSQLTDDLIDATARREIVDARIRTAEKQQRSDDVAQLRQELRQIVSDGNLPARLDKLQQSLQAAGPVVRQNLQPRVNELRQRIEQLQTASKVP